MNPIVFSADRTDEAAFHAMHMIRRYHCKPRCLFIDGVKRVIVSDARVSDHHRLVGIYDHTARRAEVERDIREARTEERRRIRRVDRVSATRSA